MESVSAERERPQLGPDEDAARKRAAVETYARNETALRKTARRYSLCEADADDALQRALEIVLRKAPTADPRELVKWTQTVVKHEALALRGERERLLAGPAAAADADDWVALLPSRSDGPAERAERREAVARSREALQTLKPQELRALTLLAEGYSYAEIGEITSWSRTKVNRCLAEGRERFRSLVSRSEDGRRCAELRPLLSAFCDGEAGAKEVVELREHLRACSHCRATLRTYRSAPATAAALAPTLPLDRSLFERLQDAIAEFAGRLGGAGGGSTTAASSGGTGLTALAKVAAVCIGTAGGAAACVAGGIVPAPPGLGGEHDRPAAIERQVESPESSAVTYEPAPEPPPPAPKPKRHPKQSHPVAEVPAETEPVAAEPAAATGGEAIEYAPPPEPAPVASSGEGNPAGEFGP